MIRKLSTALAKFISALRYTRGEIMGEIFYRKCEENPNVVDTWIKEDDGREILHECMNEKKEKTRI